MSEQLPPEQASADYRTLLIDARTQSWLTHEEISQATGLRVAYLEALEQGTLESVVSAPHVRSMLVCYGSYLGLDPDLLMRAYETTVGSSGPRTDDASGQARVLFPGRVSVDKRGVRRRKPERTWHTIRYALAGLLTVGAIVGCAAAVVLVDPLHLDLIARVGTVSLAAGTTEGRPALTTTTSTAGAVVVVSTATTPSTTTTPSPTTATTTPGSTTTTKLKKHTVRIVPTGEVWLEITSESGSTVLFRGTKKAGEELSFKVFGPLKVTVGRPEMVTVFLNGVAAPLPGSGLWLITATEVRKR